MTVLSAPPVAPPVDPRLAAFCSSAAPEVFHSIVYQPQIWTPDPFDVEGIHGAARGEFEHLLHRVTAAPPPEFGRILLLLGESGSGKTHLMRAFRNLTHRDRRGYCGYLQMTSQASNYARYLLRNLIEALDQPYYAPAGSTSGLMQLAQGLLETLVTPEECQQFRDGYVADLIQRIEEYTDLAIRDDRFAGVDLDLVRALFYLLRDDPTLKTRVLKWLRCEDLAPADRARLGDLVPRIHEEDPQQMIVQLGRLMAAVHQAALVLCVDQLEDMFNQDEPIERFRKMIDTVVAVGGMVPSSVVVIACLEDYYTANRQNLSAAKLARLEQEPKPMRLSAQRTLEEIEDLISQRLEFLFDRLDVPFDEQMRVFPFTQQHLSALTNLRTRDVLDFCRRHQERCIRAGQWLEPSDGQERPGEKEKPDDKEVIQLEQEWNDSLAAFEAAVPDDEAGLAKLLAWAIPNCSEELSSGHVLECDVDGRMVSVEIHAPDNSVDRLLVALCEKRSQGGGLSHQIEEVQRRAGETRLAVVRSTAFPTSPNAAVVKLLGKLIDRGDRRVLIENAEWRKMLALRAFTETHKGTPHLAAWRKQARPLTQLHGLGRLLALDRLHALRAEENKPAAKDSAVSVNPPSGGTSPGSGSVPDRLPETGPLLLGTNTGLTASPVVIDAEELKQHAAFLGASGSGKTTAALQLIEQLLLRGIPAVLLDRKGDLCVYADDALWQRPLADDTQARLRQTLRERLDVAVFTPGASRGRPLLLPIVPAGMDSIHDSEREQLSGYAAAALGGMMGYRSRGADQTRLAVLRKAIEVLAACPGRTVTVPALRQLIEDRDEALLHAVGGFDDKVYKKLGEDLLTLWLQHRPLLDGAGETLDLDALFGLGTYARPGKTRLNIISTRFFADSATTEFWMAQFLIALGRWIGRRPSSRLQAVLLFDEADQYLPATRQPATKAPMENLLKRARSAGVGLLLATQSPGDFDYKCRDTIRTWLVGKVKEQTALNKLKPMFAESKIDVAAKLPVQGPGQFYLMRDKEVCSLRTPLSAAPTEQLAEERILELARRCEK